MPSNNQSNAITQVPCNIITGFLGVGKTSMILNLLKNKPDNERWAVLVNEFGEIGIDGSLFEGQHREDQGVFVKEVPGGCMCCAAGLPMQIALNQLLARANPDRLLIEPTGLGHPSEVLSVLQSEYYREVLNLHATICLVDARKLQQVRYREHPSFIEQISVADVVIGNKADLYSESDRQALTQYLKTQHSSKLMSVFAEHSSIDITLLNQPSQTRAEVHAELEIQSEVQAESKTHVESHHHHHDEELVANQSIPESGYLSAKNQGQGFSSQGWRFGPEKTFSRQKLQVLFTGIEVERLKAVFITDDGIYAYNATSDTLTELEIDECYESRIEVIAESIRADLEQKLFNCLI